MPRSPLRRARSKLLAALALLTASVLAAPPAFADPFWELYDTTHARKIAVGDVLTASGTLTFTLIVDSFPVRVECHLPAGAFSRTVAVGDQLSAAPGNPLTVFLAADTVLSTFAPGSKQGVCQDISGGISYGSGVPVDVTTTGALVAVDFTMPAPDPGIWLGSLTADLKLPQNLLNFSDAMILCDWRGPTPASGASFSGTYTAGVLTTNIDVLDVEATPPPGCTVGTGKLESASLIFSPKLSVLY